MHGTVGLAAFGWRLFPRYPVVFEVDGFNEKACPNDDVYPCDRKAQEFPNFRVTFGAEMKPLDK